MLLQEHIYKDTYPNVSERVRATLEQPKTAAQ